MLRANSISTPTPWPESVLQRSVFDRFKAIAQQYPLRPAIFSMDAKPKSYSQLLSDCITIAGELYRTLCEANLAGTTSNVGHKNTAPIAILLPPGADVVSVMLAAIRLGRPYLTLDPEHPRERLLAIMHHAGCELVVCNTEEPLRDDVNVVCQSVTVQELLNTQPSTASFPCEAKATDNAYILYTSGSTGAPKGVYQDQRGLLHDVKQYSKAIGISHLDCFTGFYSPSVNGAIRDIWAALLNGAAVVPASPQRIGFAGMASVVSKFNVTIFHAIPPLLRAFLASQPNLKNLISVRVCYIAGDKFYTREVTQLYRYFPDDTQIYTGIGSTECATLYRHWLLDKNTPLTTTLLPAGYAVDGRITRLVAQPSLDDEDKVEQGEVGFVQVECAYLARGYWQNTELTNSAFSSVQNEKAQKRFMPGDCFRELSNGLFEYVGRADSQVKLRGHRVDVADVEAFCREWLAEHCNALHPDVCKVVAHTIYGQYEEKNSMRLIGIVCIESLSYPLSVVEERILPELKGALAQHYTAAAQPSAFLIHDSFPRLPNYKLDLAALKKWITAQLSTHQSEKPIKTNKLDSVLSAFEALPSHNEWLRVMVSQWCTFFNVSPTTKIIRHNWQDVDADSLTIMNFFAELDNRLGIRIDYQNIPLPFSLKALYRFIANQHSPQNHKRVSNKNLIVVPPFVGLAGLPDFDHVLHKNIRITKVPTTALYNPIGEMQPQLSDVVLKLVQYIEHLGLTGELYFYGISSGAKPAFLAAEALQTEAADVRTVFIGDAGPYGRAQHFGAERLRAFSWLSKDLPTLNSAVIEIVAMKNRNNQSASDDVNEWKDFTMLGWHQYASQIGFITVPHDHVACLTHSRVMNAINSEIMNDAKGSVIRFSTNKESCDAIKAYANSLFLSTEPQKLADAACWYQLLLTLKPALQSIYHFNGTFSRLRAINRLNLLNEVISDID